MKVFDLFSGIGCFTLGLERAGMTTVGFCEIDPFCRAVLKKNFPHIPCIPNIKDLMLYPNAVDVLCGGFPCQDISVAGYKKGINANRSGLWTEFRRLINECKPKYAIIENVANLRSNGLTRVLQDLWKIGYCAEWKIISAAEMGAPHLRERAWIVAYPESARLSRQRRAVGNEAAQPLFVFGDDFKGALPYADYYGRWFAATTAQEKSKWWAKAWSSLGHWRSPMPKFRRVDDGRTKELDSNNKIIQDAYECERKERVKSLGNALIPQIAEAIGKQILKRASALTHRSGCKPAARVCE